MAANPSGCWPLSRSALAARSRVALTGACNWNTAYHRNDRGIRENKQPCAKIDTAARAKARIQPETHVGVAFEGFVSRQLAVWGFEGKDFVAIRRGDFDPAIPVAMFYVGAAKNDEAALNLVDVLQEAHLRRLST
jgi:hypothetical protein